MILILADTREFKEVQRQMANGVLTPLQLIAGAGLLQNQGIMVNASLQQALNTYNNGINSTPLIQPLNQTIVQGHALGVLSPSTIAALTTIGASTVPALSNSVPAGYPQLQALVNGAYITPGFSGLIISAGYFELGDNGSGINVSRFVQALNAALGYIQFTDDFVTSAVNSQTYLGNTFTNMNNMVTGDITQVTTDSKAFGADLLALGNLINLQALNDLGSPALLLYQIASQIGVVPDIQQALVAEGLPNTVAVDLNDPRASFSDTVQRLMYTAMTKITGAPLENILKGLRITTKGITTLADLLNPVKLFPNSFLSLRVVTVEGEQQIYFAGDSVNQNLEELLPPYYISSVA